MGEKKSISKRKRVVRERQRVEGKPNIKAMILIQRTKDVGLVKQVREVEEKSLKIQDIE